MNKHPLLTLVITCVLASASSAAEDHPALESQTAQQLISRVLDTRLENVSVGSITYGSLRKDDGFEHQAVCRVVAVVTVYENGLNSRKIRNLNFLWSTQHGWFYQEVVSQRGREELRIWSEVSGDFTVK